ncbi:MAG TPA: DUF4399 domain-containing protein [Longimicrobiales bacterium]|jgi:hypothetical protein
MRTPAAMPLLLTTLTALACAGEPAEEEAPPAPEAAPAASEPAQEAAAPDRRVVIAYPTEGDTVDGAEITVRLEAVGFQVVPAGDTTSNSGHHHVFLDRDVSEPGVPIPAEEGFIIHMGTGVSELVLPVSPGEHRLIAVVGDALHVPLRPWVVDTVRFVVREGM